MTTLHRLLSTPPQSNMVGGAVYL